MAKRKTIFILVEDSRETGLLSGDGITGTICYSLKETCVKLLKPQSYFNPDQRKWIKEMWDKYGPIKAYHDHTASAWLYCPTYVKRQVKL